MDPPAEIMDPPIQKIWTHSGKRRAGGGGEIVDHGYRTIAVENFIHLSCVCAHIAPTMTPAPTRKMRAWAEFYTPDGRRHKVEKGEFYTFLYSVSSAITKQLAIATYQCRQFVFVRLWRLVLRGRDAAGG